MGPARRQTPSSDHQPRGHNRCSSGGPTGDTRQPSTGPAQPVGTGPQPALQSPACPPGPWEQSRAFRLGHRARAPPSDLSSGNQSTAQLVPWGGHDKVPQSRQLKPQSRRLDIQGSGACRLASPEASPCSVDGPSRRVLVPAPSYRDSGPFGQGHPRTLPNLSHIPKSHPLRMVGTTQSTGGFSCDSTTCTTRSVQSRARCGQRVGGQRWVPQALAPTSQPGVPRAPPGPPPALGVPLAGVPGPALGTQLRRRALPGLRRGLASELQRLKQGASLT